MFMSFLGLGQGGGNIADEAAKNGFYSAAINFSQGDLDSLEVIDKKLKLVGSDGIGKQRSDAIRLMDNNWDLVVNFVKENFSHSSIEIIFVPFSTAGGSGSGIAPIILSLLSETMPDKVFVAMPIIPDKKEVYTSQRNCVETFEDISELGICTMPIDNDKGVSTLNNVGKSNLYKSVNGKTIQLIKKLIVYTEKSSKFGVLDKKDLKNLFQTQGIASIGEVNLMSLTENNDISEDSIVKKIIKSWHESPFVDIETSQIIKAGIIFDGQESLMEFINVEKLFSCFNNRMPISLFEGYYTEKQGSILTVLSGLSWCNARLEEIEEILQSTTQEFKKINHDTGFKSKLTNQDLLETVPKSQKVKDISSIISKFKRQKLF